MDKISVDLVPFRFKYFKALVEMLESQKYPNIAAITMKTLPKIGYLAMVNGYPVACGFLRRVEGNLAQLDGLTSNANFGSQVRHEGIKSVVDALIADAKRLKLDGIIATTADKGTFDRAMTLGFKSVPQAVIALNLKQTDNL